MSMNLLVKAVPAQKPRTKESLKISIFFAVILLIMAMTQLYTFEEFADLVPRFNLPLGEVLIYTLAPLIVVCEVFALPFLLRMTVSPAFRWLSMMLGWLAAAIWLLVSIWICSTGPDVPTVGFLGTIVELPVGFWAIFMSFALCILAAWSSWGLWPGKRLQK